MSNSIQNEANPDQVVIICFMFTGLLIGCFITYLLSQYAPQVPYTVVVFLIGIILSVLTLYVNLLVLEESINLWNLIPPDLILFIFLPALLFGESMSLNIHHLRCTFIPSLILAGPGAVLGTFLLGAFAKVILPYSWSWRLCFTFGSILCATDPVGK
jgi:NhaP-type Na+/H+ or K+/H+ antiporter